MLEARFLSANGLVSMADVTREDSVSRIVSFGDPGLASLFGFPAALPN
ncbi:MAG TPA: hypothetical protein VHT26_01570 [Trebonia sp.]|nr:hypothetical protein [Trebonia sp.]